LNIEIALFIRLLVFETLAEKWLSEVFSLVSENFGFGDKWWDIVFNYMFFFQIEVRIRREELQNSSWTSNPVLEDLVSCVFTLFQNKTTSKGKGLS